MNEVNLPPFYVGQKVIRTGDGTNLIVKGKEYIVSEIRWCCTKWGWRINVVGISPKNKLCEGCNTLNTLNFAAKYFAPIQENFQSISLSKVLEEESKLISVN